MLRRIREKIELLATYRRRYGTGATMVRVIDPLLRRLFHVGVSRVMWLEMKNDGESLDPSFEFRFLTADEVRRFSAEPENNLDPALAVRIEEGRNRCFAALTEDRLAAFAWYAIESVEPKHAASLSISLPKDVVYQYHVFTHPDFRGKRLSGLLMTRALNTWSEEAIVKQLSLIAWMNQSALRSCHHLGSTNLGRLIQIGWFGYRLAFYPTAALRKGIDFGPRFVHLEKTEPA